MCPAIISTDLPKSSFGLVKATLVSLWYARNSMEHGTDFGASNLNDDAVSLLTTQMAIQKASIQDFYCAQRSLKSFTDSKDSATQTASSAMIVFYEDFINLNKRRLELIKKIGRISQVEFSDQVSTIDVESSRRWLELAQAVGLALLSLRDFDHHLNEKGEATRLIITTVQKKALLDWIDRNFPELKKTSEAQWRGPTQIVQICVDFLAVNKCADE